jgi:putative transposase
MSRVVGDWKRYQERELGIAWQDGYFDHRLRNDDEFDEKCHYIRMNPVRRGLCGSPAEWPWVVEPWREAETG